MNTAGCPAGFSTDMTFSVARPQLECQSSLVIFWVFVGIYIVYRVLLTILQVRIAMHMRKVRKEAQKKAGRSARVSMTTVAEVIHTVGALVAWPLLGFNIINSENGSGPAVVAIVMFPFFLAYVLSTLKLVHLGHRVLPRSIRNQFVGTTSQPQDPHLNSIKADPVLVILFGVMISCMFLSLVFQVFIGLIYHPGTTDLWFRLGMGSQALLCLSGAAIIYRQTYRVVHFINIVHRKNMNIINGGSSGARVDKTLDRTIQGMKIRQFAVGLGVFCSNVFFWLCAGGVYTPWYFVYMTFIASIIAATGTTVMYMPSHMSICCCCCRRLSSSPFRAQSKLDTDTGLRVTDLKTTMGIKPSSDHNSAVVPEQPSP